MVAAHVDFLAGLGEVELLIGAQQAASLRLPKVDDLNAASDERLGTTLRRAAVVLLVSHFEGYLKRLCEEYVDAISTGALESRAIPAGVRDIHILPRINEIASTGDLKQRMVLTKKLSDVSALWRDDAKPPPGTLRAELVSHQVTNADADCIDHLFEILGYSSGKICDGSVDVRSSGDADELETQQIRPRLRDVVKCRNDIAHGDTDRQPTQNDVDRYLAFLREFAARLDRQLQGIIGRLTLS